jgi:mRNA interferase MazF
MNLARAQRGEVWLVDLGMAAKVRPCLILSIPATDVDRALVTVVPHTTAARGSRFEVPSQTNFLKEGVFDAQNLITIPHAKLLRKLGNLSDPQMEVVEGTVIHWLGLEPRD